jgi:transcription termination/antitermination protein NusG
MLAAPAKHSCIWFRATDRRFGELLVFGEGTRSLTLELQRVAECVASAHQAEVPGAASARWYALAVHARQERAAATALEERGFEVFLPTRCQPRLWSDRVQRLNLALFPGYLFLRATLTASRRVEMLRLRQVYDLVGRTPGSPAIARPVPDSQIESLRRLTASKREFSPAERLVRGDEVVVCVGPLRGTRGVLVSEPLGKRRLAVQIPLLGRAVRTWLTADDLLKAPA